MAELPNLTPDERELDLDTLDAVMEWLATGKDGSLAHKAHDYIEWLGERLALVGGDAETPEEKDDAWNRIERRMVVLVEVVQVLRTAPGMSRTPEPNGVYGDWVRESQAALACVDAALIERSAEKPEPGAQT